MATPAAFAINGVNRAEWGAAVAVYRKALEDEQEYGRKVHDPAWTSWKAFRAQWPIRHDFRHDPDAAAIVGPRLSEFEPISERYEQLADRTNAAFWELMRTPAPNCAALAQKIEIALEAGELDGWDETAEIVKLCLADARRRRYLRGSGRSLSAKIWDLRIVAPNVAP